MDRRKHNDYDMIFETNDMSGFEEEQVKLSKNARNIFLVILFMVLGVGMVFYCIHYSSKEYIEGNVLTVAAITTEPTDTYDLCCPWKNASFTGALLFQTLFVTDSGCSEINDGLALSYSCSDDGLTYSITMSENEYWSDGEIIDVNDVAFSVEAFLMCDDVNASLSTAFNKIEGVEAYLAGDSDSIIGITCEDNTITFQLEERYNNFAMILTQFVVLPEHILKEEDLSTLTDEHWFFQNDNPVCSGMYVSTGFDEDMNIVLSQNVYYTGEMSDIETVLVCWDWESRDIDYFESSIISDTVSYRSLREYTEYAVDVSYYRYFVFNVANSEVVQDAQVRQAINYAIDIEELFSDYYFSTGSLVYAGDTNASIVYEYNPEKAIELLEEANYDFDYIYEIGYYHTDSTTRVMLEKVCEYLNAIGIQTELRQLEGWEIYVEPTYDMLFKALSAFNIEDWYNEYLMTSTNLAVLMGEDGVFDELIANYSAAINQEEQIEYQNQITQLEQELLYKLPLFTSYNYIFLNTSRVDVPDDLEFGNVRYFCDLRLDEWSILKS